MWCVLNEKQLIKRNYGKGVDRMTEKRLFQELEGTIVKDKKGHRYRFHNGLLWGMCHLEPFKLEEDDVE